MKLSLWALVLLFSAAGCASHPLPVPEEPMMTRDFHGTIVPGHYVSPSAYLHYMQAQLAADEGRTEAAVEELRRALASDGASPYLRARLSEELLALGRVDDARDEVVAALHLDPHFAEGYVDLARVEMSVGDLGQAEQALHRAVVEEPTCEEAYLALVDLYRARQDDARVAATWRELAAQVPTSAEAHAALGHLAAARGDGAQAEVELERALALDASMQATRIELAKVYQGEGRIEDALTTFQDAYERSGDLKIAETLVHIEMGCGLEDKARELVDRMGDEGGGTERRLTLGWLRVVTHEPEKARAVAHALLKTGESAAARLLDGAALEELGHRDDAVAELRQVPAGSGSYVQAQLRIGRMLSDGGNYDAAAQDLVQAIAAVGSAGATGAGDALEELLAEVHERAGEAKKGIAELESALGKRPRSADLALALGGAYQRAGQWQHAIAIVRKVLALQPENPQALNFVGYALADHGVRLDEAERLLKKAAALRPESGEIADSLGWLYAKLGRLDAAERQLVRADRLAPAEPEILEHLGEVYMKKADRVHALDAYKRALAHNPDERVRHMVEERLLLLQTERVGSR